MSHRENEDRVGGTALCWLKKMLSGMETHFYIPSSSQAHKITNSGMYHVALCEPCGQWFEYVIIIIKNSC